MRASLTEVVAFLLGCAMDSSRSALPLLDKASADFIQHHVTITVAARDARNIPAIARAFGCSVSADYRSVTVFLAPLRATAVLKNLRDNGVIAVVVSRPRTHETLQLKGAVTTIQRISPQQGQIMAKYLHSFMEELTGMGYKPVITDSFAPEVDEDCLAVSFEPAAVFVQTPGPHAGQRLEPRP